jgi:hypothetical protein
MKSATKYVCWVTGLVVALGIWAWLASVPWPTSADPADTAASLGLLEPYSQPHLRDAPYWLQTVTMIGVPS